MSWEREGREEGLGAKMASIPKKGVARDRCSGQADSASLPLSHWIGGRTLKSESSPPVQAQPPSQQTLGRSHSGWHPGAEPRFPGAGAQAPAR